MMTKVTIKTPREAFQVDIDPSQTVAELKTEINKFKGYMTETQKLIHSGKSFGKLLADSQVFETIGFNDKDFLVLLVSKAKALGPLSTGISTAIGEVEHSSQTSSSPSSLSIKAYEGKEVIRYNEHTVNETVLNELPIENRPQLIGPSPKASQGVSQPQTSASSSTSLSARPPPFGPASSEQNHNQISIGGQGGNGTLGNMGNLASMEEMIRTDPSMCQRFIEAAAQHDPAFGQERSQNSALLDSLMRIGRTKADREHPNIQTSMLTAEERGAVQHLVDLGFNEKQVIEAYLVSDKNEELAVNYLLNTDSKSHGEQATEEPSIGQSFLEDPSLRQRLAQFIAQQNPAIAQQINENPALLEMALQEYTVQKLVLTSEENRAVGHMEDLGFTRQKALEAYLICDKNEEHAINYLVSTPHNGSHDSRLVVLPEVPGNFPNHATSEPAYLPEDVPASAFQTPVGESSSQSMAMAHIQGEFGADENTQSHSSMAQLVHGSPSFHQMLAQYMIERNPALGQLRNENPALFDQALGMACLEAEHASSALQTTTLSAEDREAIQRLVNVGFDQCQATEAYLVSDKSKELALNYMLDQQN